jgi:hypothetical protein
VYGRAPLKRPISKNDPQMGPKEGILKPRERKTK